MEIEQLRKEFNQVLANIIEHSERFTGTDHVPALEVSVMMSKINKLQEIAAILKYKIQKKEENRRQYNNPKVITELETNPNVVEEIVEPNPEKDVAEINSKAPEFIVIKQEPITEPTPSPKEPKIETSQTSKASIGDKFLHTPISSLQEAFSLNDRYLFANELFKKDMALFNETVKTIDASKTLMEAQEYLNFVKINLNWDSDNERVISFYELVERRFLHID